MRRSGAGKKRYVESSDSEDDRPLKKSSPEEKKPNSKPEDKDENSSSESDIEKYLQKPEKLDLNSDFFNTRKNEVPEFDRIEQNIFSGVTRLSDSDSNSEDEKAPKEKKKPGTPKVAKPKPEKASSSMTFSQLQDYTKKMEEAKKFIDIYKAKKQAEENKTDIFNLLTAGESLTGIEHTITPADLHSSDFESCDSEKEDWEEIKSKPSQEVKDKGLVPEKDLQITVDMPDHVKKKKGVDLLAAMKRRLNRIRKDNQVLVHKVHLLSWIAHGNYVSSAINDPQTLAMALSLVPSEQSYPSDRPDLGYLEKIVSWFKKVVINVEKPAPDNMPWNTCLQLQINKKEAYNKKMLACIFVAILRALGIQCRIVMSLQVEPLRPPANELHSLSAKDSEKKVIKKEYSKRTNGIDKVSPKQGESKLNLKNLQPRKSLETAKNTKKDAENVLKIPKTRRRSKSVDSEASVGGTGGSTRAKKAEASSQKPLKNAQKVTGDKKEVEKMLKVPKTRERTKSADSEASMGGTGSSTRAKKGKSEAPPQKTQKVTRDKNVAENILKVPKTRARTKSADSEISTGSARSTRSKKNKSEESQQETKSKADDKNRNSADVKEASRRKTSTLKPSRKSQSSKNSEKTKEALSTRIPAAVPQVDGNFDSDSDMTLSQLDGANDKKAPPNKVNLKKLKRAANKNPRPKPNLKSLKKYVEDSDSDSEFEPSSKSPVMKNLAKLKAQSNNNFKGRTMDVKEDIVKLVKARIKEQKFIDKRRTVKKRTHELESTSDSDFVPEPIKKKHHDSEDEFVPKVKVKRRVQLGNSVLSDVENGKKKKKGNDVWVEVFLEAEEKWISVDVVHGLVHCVKELYQRASCPVAYVVGWDNNNNLKDVTQRYCQNFNTVTRKLRVDAKWWSQSIEPFIGVPNARDKEEDDDLARQQLDRPLPKAISEYKNHPLYVLKRHLLKFEALYPPEPPTLGFIRGEAVYPRSCIYTLHSRDIWLKQAKVVKLGEQPYKIVKARPKYDRLSNKMITDQLLEIFGPWQVQDYEPPTAIDGNVPKNAFGNVDLFKPCMLPKGCVHLKLPGLNKIARKLQIDCAAAIVGFDFHGGWSHPVYDGFVVCKEYEDQLIFAWEEEQDELERKEQEKLDKRVYGNWKKLIKGLLIRERLKAKYDFGQSSKKEEKEKKKGPTFCTRS